MTKLLALSLAVALPVLAADPKNPTWWDKYTFLNKNGPDPFVAAGNAPSTGTNVDVSNECGPQSETYIAINSSKPRNLAAGSNEIFRLPMRGYFSSDSGATWGGVDLPLPAAIGANGIDFGSDPTLAFDSSNNLYYGYIVVFFGAGAGVKGTEMAVARSTDGGRTYPQVTFFEFSGGSDHFNDKPMIAADPTPGSPFRDRVYLAWDAALGGSSSGGVRVARSSDRGLTFSTARIDDPKGPGNSIGATVTTGPDGQVYVAWNDVAANAIAFNRSFDGGATWDSPPRTISSKTIPFDIGIPAESVRRALVYPACDVDRSKSAHRGRITCSWMDLTAQGTTDILASFSDDQGVSWSRPAAVSETFPGLLIDRFNHWLATDPVTGEVNVSYYDTRNDSTGSRFETDVYLSRSADGSSFRASQRITTAVSNEHDCNGLFPCPSINYGNQQGDYEGIAAFGGVAHPIWTDSRRNQEDITAACPRGLMEEVFTATVK
jgi:hypothetical protein